jgi:hypothetical protein
MLIIIGIWKINFDLNKPAEINFNNSNNLKFPAFPKIEEGLGELNEGIDNINKSNEKELFEEDKKEIEENKIEEELENKN